MSGPRTPDARSVGRRALVDAIREGTLTERQREALTELIYQVDGLDSAWGGTFGSSFLSGLRTGYAALLDAANDLPSGNDVAPAVLP